MDFNVHTSTGKTLTLPSAFLTIDLHRYLREMGLNEDDLQGLWVTSNELDPPRPDSLRRALQTFAPPIDVPRPQPQNKDDIMPEVSEGVLIAKQGVGGISLFTTGWDSNGTNWLPLSYLQSGLDSWRLSPSTPFPSSASVALLTYWEKKFSQSIIGAQTINKKIISSSGVSTTDTNVMSMELGVAISGLSAKLSNTLTQQVTISDQVTEEVDYSFVGKEGKAGIFTVWQLVQEFRIVDDSGKILDWRGKVQGWEVIGGWIDRLDASFPNGQFVVRSDQMALDEKFFPL